MKKICIILLAILSVSTYATAQNQADSAFYQTKESKWLKAKTGSWDVVMMMQPFINTQPQIVKGIEAERTMAGAFCLHEVMHAAKSAPMPLFQRLSDLDYNFNDTRWDYMSIDTRITAGIMYFTYYQHTGDSIVSYILNFPHPGFGPGQKDRGKNVRVRNVIIAVSADQELVNQYWKLTDDKEWLAVQYRYTRKK